MIEKGKYEDELSPMAKKFGQLLKEAIINEGKQLDIQIKAADFSFMNEDPEDLSED